MEEGFILDRAHYNAGTIETWVEGEPVKSIWSGVKTKDKQQFGIKTFRCAGCGFLESYATEDNPVNSIFS